MVLFPASWLFIGMIRASWMSEHPRRGLRSLALEIGTFWLQADSD
jgi:hypothetical protein